MNLNLVSRMLKAIVLVSMTLVFSATFSVAQTTDDARAATGGGQTLEDILVRQEGVKVDDTFRREQTGEDDGAATTEQLGTLGGNSDADVYRAYRFGAADIIVSSRTNAADVVIQSSGMKWLNFRAGPLRTYGGWLLLVTLAGLIVFYFVRGKIRVEGGMSGITIERFKPLERFGHWLLAGSFILLAITGLTSLFGRVYLIPIFGKETFSSIAVLGKFIHNNVAWAFIISLVWIFVFWVAHNIPAKHDLAWMAKGGGLFTKGVHPPAKKFNAGQKVIFWSVIILGGSIALSGVSLLFPFELPLFAKSFAAINLLGFDLPSSLLPHQEMQLAQIWHAVVSFILIAIVAAHIYLGSVGMEGAYDAMGSGHVDKQWAKEHHSLWVEEVEVEAEEVSAELSDEPQEMEGK